MPVAATDSFTGANGTALPAHDSRWIEINGSFDLLNNGARCDNAAGVGIFQAAGWSGQPFADDQYSECTLGAVVHNDFMGVIVRGDIYAPAVTFYIYWGHDTNQYLHKVVAGAFTPLDSLASGWSLGDVIRLEANGTTLTAKLNGTTIFEVNDADISSGAPGIGALGTGATLLDIWEGGDLGGAPAADPWTAQRSTPQTSQMYMVIQQPEYSTDDGTTWTGYDWSCRINGAHTDDPTVTLTVDGGGAAVDLLDGQTVLIGSAYGEWDSAVAYVRGEQTVGPGTTSLDISTSSEIRGHVSDDDYVVVLDEFRFRQRYGRIEIVADDVAWYKDYDIEWSDLGANDAARRLAMMPPVPVMGPHAVKFVEIGGSSADVFFSWSDSYATAPGEAITTWTSEGETDHAGGTWNSAVEVPGWQTVDAISGLRGFRVTLEVDDGNGNATTLPYRRGIRYVFTLRRPGETQVGDPPNAEPIVDFELNEPVAGSFEQGYWRTSITVFASQAQDYQIMPEALVVLFTEDTYGGDSGSVGPIGDRENILLIGRILGDSIRENPETGDVTFDVASPGAEAAIYHNYPIVIQNDDAGTSWIDTPDLTVDRAVHYYTTWHTNLNQIADLYQTDSTIEIYAQDFLAGDIYSTLNQFLWDRLFARLLCDKYGRFHCEIDANEQPFGTVDTLFTLQAGDWLDEVGVRQNIQTPVNAVECGGLIYNAGTVTPKLSRAPGLYDKYRGSPQQSNALAITSQATLNTTTGRHLAALNHEHEVSMRLAGNWRYCDIAPQEAVDMNSLVTERGTLTGDYIIRAVTNDYDPSTGTLFTDIEAEEEADDGVDGVTIVIPDALPDQGYDPYSGGGLPPSFGGALTPIAGALVPGEPPADASAAGIQLYTIRYGDADDYWTDDITENPPTWNLLTHDSDKNHVVLMPSATTNRLFGYGWGMWEYAPLPLDTGAWAQIYDEDDLADMFGHLADYNEAYCFKMEFSIRPDQEEHAWAGVWIWYTDGGGDEHILIGCLHTRDAWDHIVYTTVIADWEEGVDFTKDFRISQESGLAVDHHSNTVYIGVSKAPEDNTTATATFEGWVRLYRSQDFGATFALAQEDTFTWGVDGYGVDLDDNYVDVWVPWVSDTYNGGAVFWTTTCMQQASVFINLDFIPIIYRSLNHGLSRENIGDDGGDLSYGLNMLLGPYNSLARVFGALCTQAADGGVNTVYTWKGGQAWTEFRNIADTVDQCRSMLVIEQDGYALETALALGQPTWLTDSSDTDKVRPNDDTYWMAWVY